MVSLPLARKLKQLGLTWYPKANDYFAVPDRGLDELVFVISEMMTNIEKIQGRPVVSFHGSAEWAMDYLVTSEVVWLPRESQMRLLLLEKISKYARSAGTLSPGSDQVRLMSTTDNSTCAFEFEGRLLKFQALDAADAYAHAFIHLSEQGKNNGRH